MPRSHVKNIIRQFIPRFLVIAIVLIITAGALIWVETSNHLRSLEISWSW